MSSGRGVRSICTISAVLAGMLAASTPMLGQSNPPAAQTNTQIEKYTATTVNMSPGAGERITIHILRWSTDEDRERLVGVLAEKGDAELQNALAAAPRQGYVWTSESLGYSVRFAHRVSMPDGGQRIIVVTDRRLGAWSGGAVWKASNQSAAPDYPFTLIELRLNRRGSGEGKMSLSTKVSADRTEKTVGLEDYRGAPVLLKDAKHERAGDRSTN